MANQKKISKSYQDVWVSRDEDLTSCWKFNVNIWLDKPIVKGDGIFSSEVDDNVSWICSMTILEFKRIFGFEPKFGECQLCRTTIHPRSGKQMHAERKMKKEAPINKELDDALKSIATDEKKTDPPPSKPGRVNLK